MSESSSLPKSLRASSGSGWRKRLLSLLTTRETRQPQVLTCISLWSVCFYLVITHFVGGSVEVQGESMLPTLRHGETYMLNRWIYHFRSPRQGELVVIRDPGYTDLAIKRVIGVAGDTVVLENGSVRVNDTPLSEPYLARNVSTSPNSSSGTRFHLARNQFFVLGDNRPQSLDSRIYGPIQRSQIIGRVQP